MARLWIATAGIAAALAASVVAAQPRTGPAPSLARWTNPTLTPFENEAEFRRYLRTVQQAQRASYAARSERRRARQYASLQDPAEDPCAGLSGPALDACLGGGASDEGSIAVTGARVSNPSITNVQEAGVDEGDIVKQIGQFLLVLQDGRITTIDTRPANGAGLTLLDRVDVYRSEDEDTWYDEMLVAGDRVLITGYSYAQEATELSIFRIDSAGRLRREGVFYMSSNDYYDTQNYATRIIGDRLVVYTPIDVSDIDLDEALEWPVVRRWQSGAARTRPARGRPLLGARDIYRPVRQTLYPIVHTISVCPLSSTASGGNLACTTTGFIGERDKEFHVSPTDAFVWVTAWPGEYGDGSDDDNAECASGHRPAQADATPATLFRLPLSGGEPGLIGTRGDPINFLSLDTGGGRFRALVRWPSTRCRFDEQTYPLTLFDTGLGRFGDTLVEAPARAYTPVPSVGTSALENRFTDRYLVYGGRSGWGSYPPEQPIPLPQQAAVVPLDRPAEARLIDLPHSIIRIEQAGEDAVLTGYRDDSALDVSLIDLSATPRLASTVRLPGRYESEGRSHAFNSLVDADGSGVMGLPTTHRVQESGRWWSYSNASDVSFVSVDASGRLERLGELLSYQNLPEGERRDARLNAAGVALDYRCEVSCIDWYGNTRPVFTDGRVFALAGTELVEGRIEAGRIREVRRLNMTIWPPRGR